MLRPRTTNPLYGDDSGAFVGVTPSIMAVGPLNEVEWLHTHRGHIGVLAKVGQKVIKMARVPFRRPLGSMLLAPSHILGGKLPECDGVFHKVDLCTLINLSSHNNAKQPVLKVCYT